MISNFLISFVAAALLAWISVRITLRRSRAGIKNGPWRTDLTLSTGKDNMYAQAYMARRAYFALRAPEVVYFVAQTDSKGDILRPENSYRIEGGDPDTRWWNVTVYNNDRMIPNPSNRYSYSQTNVQRKPDGRWTIHLSPQESAENWLPSASASASTDGVLKLIFRFYHPGRSVLDHPEKADLPRIERTSNQ